MNYNQLPTKEVIDKTIAALANSGFKVFFAENGEAAKQTALSMIPAGAKIMNMTSATLETIGLVKEIMESENFQPVRKQLQDMDIKTQKTEMKKLRSVPDWAIGSVHAITQDGQLMVASATGSQMPAYVYGAEKVLLIAGAQKIVDDLNTGFDRIYQYCLPLESERAKKAYGDAGSSVNKILILNQEEVKERTTVIIVNKILGF